MHWPRLARFCHERNAMNLMIKLLSAALVTVVLAVTPGHAGAQEDSDEPTTRELVDAQLIRYREQLALGDYQWAQVEQILRSDIRERVAIARRFGLDGSEASAASLEKKQVRALEKQLKNSREFTEERMKRYLDKPKFKEFKALQEQIHDEFEARLEAAREGQAS